MFKYYKQKKLLLAIDCIILGFDNKRLKILLIKRGFEPEKGRWSLMGGFVQPDETPDEAASRVLKKLTGLKNIYLSQFGIFGNPQRDPAERTVSIAYFALIDIQEHEKMINVNYHAEWFPVNKFPRLIFDHPEMVAQAMKKLQLNAALHPILFEMLPPKFTLPQLRLLYRSTYGTKIDARNFNRKILSTGLLVKQKEKEKLNSKKGAFYFKLNKRKYNTVFHSSLISIPRLF